MPPGKRSETDLLAWRDRPFAPDLQGRLGRGLRGAYGSASRLKIRIRSVTSFARLRPTFFVIGEEKCGTSAIYAYLMQHPAVLGYWNKEVRYFDRFYDRGEAWYLAHFPLAFRGRVAGRRAGVEPAVGEASPNYLFHPEAAERLRRFEPEARLIVMARDPVERAYSRFRLDLARSAGIAATFEEAIELSLAGDRRVRGLLLRGRYVEQLERWRELFPAEQILVLRTEDLAADGAATVRAALDFLGLSGEQLPAEGLPPVNSRPGPPMLPETRAFLERYYEEPNRRLYELLGRDLGWARPAEQPVSSG
jgi:sulfotransferase family protein